VLTRSMSEAMPPRSRSAQRLTISLVALVGLLSLPATAGAQSAGTITGVAFKDMNRDGVRQPDEEP
jgi:hypothetical protein